MLFLVTSSHFVCEGVSFCFWWADAPTYIAVAMRANVRRLEKSTCVPMVPGGTLTLSVCVAMDVFWYARAHFVTPYASAHALTFGGPAGRLSL